MAFPTPTICPKCGDKLSSAIPSARVRGTVVQTCRNVACLHTARTMIEMAEQPVTPALPRRLPLEPSRREAPPRQPVPPPSAIERFEDAHRKGETRQAIRQVRRELRAAAGDDGRSRRIGGER